MIKINKGDIIMIFVLVIWQKNGIEIIKWQIFQQSWKIKGLHECFQIKYPEKLEILVF